MTVPGCPLCEGPGGRLVWAAAPWRLVHAAEPGFPAFYRLVRDDHVREFSQLPVPDRVRCMEILAEVEQVLLARLAPTKVNLASLGNAVPHLHWHVIARFDWDSHFPGPVWASALRQVPPERLAALEEQLPALEQALVRCLSGLA